ncbi:hypothetical protein DTO212C5_284 [Paecilomyces variotii]|nr:hypothetical protein DTO212C5_284 [Paecilomyces variotii]
MAPGPVFVPPEQWRHLLRATLRECSYLPDPIARGYMRDHVRERYRHHASKYRSPASIPVPKQFSLRRAARHTLSLLQRANEGYLRPLEKVMLLSYGRIGRRRHELLEPLLTPEVPPDSEAVTKMIQQPSRFEDGWQPPSIVVDLLKSQQKNGIIGKYGVRPQVKTLMPKIPAENSWGRPLAVSRRRNIRKRWYAAALDSLLPPLPEEEARLLQDLISGAQPWAPVKRRKGLTQPTTTQALDAKFLVQGPQKGHTFGAFANGRPHNITRRFMRRVWERLSCMIPRMETIGPGKAHFEWGTPSRTRREMLTVDKDQASVLFAGVDSDGKIPNEHDRASGH